MIKYLPQIDRDNADLENFLIPFEAQHAELIEKSTEVGELMQWDKSPHEFLPSLASLLGFELLDIPYITETELRDFLKWIVWIYRRKGTKAGAEKIIELLGFSHTWNEIFPDFVPFVSNFHRTWSKDLIIASIFFDDFSGNLSAWTNLNLTSWWRIVSDRYHGTGNGGVSDTNASVFTDNKSSYYFSVEFEIISGYANNKEFGFYLKYVDTINWVRLEIQRNGLGVDSLVLTKEVSGVPDSLSLGTIGVDITTGTHILWVWNDGKNNWTGGIDDIVIGYDELFIGITNGIKGLWVNEDLVIAFDEVTVEEINFSQMAKTFSTAFTDREVEIGITGYPTFAETVDIELANIRDTFLFSATPTTNYGSNIDLVTDLASHRLLVIFKNLSDLIDSGAIITSAKLRMYCHSMSFTNVTVEAYRILKSWKELEATWNIWKTSLEWGTAGGDNVDDFGNDNEGDGVSPDRRLTAEASTLVNATGAWYEWELLTLAKLWLRGAALENGVHLRGISGDSSATFYSNDSADSRKPMLRVVLDNAGKRSKMEYLKQVLPNYVPAGVTITWV